MSRLHLLENIIKSQHEVEQRKAIWNRHKSSYRAHLSHCSTGGAFRVKINAKR